MPAGRPTVITEEVLQKLEEAFLNGASDRYACFLAGISEGSLYNYIKENPDYSERKELLKKSTAYLAKRNLRRKIEEGDDANSRWYLERKVKEEFSIRNEISGANGQDLVVIKEIIYDKGNNDNTKTDSEAGSGIRSTLEE